VDPALEQAFVNFGRDTQATELTAALLVARLLDATVDTAAVQAAITVLADSGPSQRPWTLLAEAGYGGAADAHDGLDNSHIGRVIETRRGLPITLAVLLIELARRGGCQATGINFPSHFLVHVDDTLIDPFAMAPVAAAQCLQWLPPGERDRPQAALFAPASAHGVALRMLNNVKNVLAGRGVWHQALDVVEAQLAVVPGQPVLHLERAELWLRMGSPRSARAALEAALVLTQAGSGQAMEQLALQIGERLLSLPEGDETLH
jgi:regulator of sirC expression with transglutaminase-like and TPR domain